MRKIVGVSPLVDGCAGLIAQQAYRAYGKLSNEHKRWMDPEDLIQQALMEAVAASGSGRYREGAGAKFSTYLTRGLHFALAKTTDRLRTGKRAAGGLVELDAPGEDARPVEVPSTGRSAESRHERARRAVFGFGELCRGCSSVVRLVMVRVLLCGQRVKPEELSVVVDEAQGVAKRLGLRWDDLEVFRDSEKIRKMALIQLDRDATIGLADTDVQDALECVECSGQFPLSAIREGRYYVSTLTCRGCYKRLRGSPESCFGKLKSLDQEGYSESDVECRLHCRDREVCRQFNTQGRKTMSDEDEVMDVEEEVELDEDEEAPKKKASPKAEKKTKKAKPAAAKKEKVDADPAPADVGGRWPWRTGSFMREIFKLAYKGISRELFEKAVKKEGREPKFWIKFLKAGAAGKKRGNVTHTWKLNEESGRLRIYDVKYFGGGAKPKVAKTKAKPAAKKAVAKSKKPVVKKQAKKAA